MTNSNSYDYGDSDWKDLLTNYNNQADPITYDEIGNPLSYRNDSTGNPMQFTWEGRDLKTAVAKGQNASYTYGDDGIRTSKVVDGTITYYLTDGGRILAQRNGGDVMWFLYDSDGTLVGFTSGDNSYYYTKNSQGDITGIVDSNSNLIVEYNYDAWGKLLSTTGSQASTIGAQNPFRYRGYYFDTETGLYYLNSRYYDPQTGRFINADSQLNAGSDLTSYNLFTYCGNNPVIYADNSGTMPFLVITALVGAVVGAVVGGVIAANSGSNVLAGIGIGAAGGALLGLGIGAGIGMISGVGALATAGEIAAGVGTGVATAEQALEATAAEAENTASEATKVVSESSKTLSQLAEKASTATGQGYKSFSELKKVVGSPGEGNQWHHIVEQSQINKSGFSSQMINNTNNITSISQSTHRQISGYYSSIQPSFSEGLRVRDWLAGQSFQAQYEFGLDVIKMFK